MDEELKYFSGQQLAVDDLDDGFYIALKPSQMDTYDFVYFRVSDEEAVPSDYVRVLRKHTNNVDNLMALSPVVIFGVVSYGYFRIIQVTGEADLNEIYPAVIKIPEDKAQEGKYFVIMSKAEVYIDQQYHPELIENDQDLTLNEWLQTGDYNTAMNVYAEGETVEGIPGYLRLTKVADEEEDY